MANCYSNREVKNLLAKILVLLCLLRFTDGCGEVLTKSSDHVKRRISRRSTCALIIKVPEGNIIFLRLSTFQIGYYDFVTVYERKNGIESFLESFSSNNKSSKVIVSLSNWMKIKIVNRNNNRRNPYYYSSSSYTNINFKYESGRDCSTSVIKVNSPYQFKIKPSCFIHYWRFSNADPASTLTLRTESMNLSPDVFTDNFYDGNDDTLRLSQIRRPSTFSYLFSSSKDLSIFWCPRCASWTFDVQRNININATISPGCAVNLTAEDGGTIKNPYYDKRMACVWKIMNSKRSSISFFADNTLNLSSKQKTLVVTDENDTVINNFSEDFPRGTKLFTSASKVIKLSFGHKHVPRLLFNRDNRRLSNFEILFSSDCTLVTNVTGGYTVGGNHYKSSIKYHCHEGYYLANGSTQTCRYGGKWSNPTPYCKAWQSPSIKASHQGFVPTGSNVTMTCISNEGITFPSLSLVNGDGIQIGNSHEVYINDIDPIVSHKYRCVEKKDNKSMHSKWTEINVTWLRFPKLTSNVDVLPINSLLQMECNADGFPEMSYQWYHNGNLLTSQTKRLYTVENTTLNHTGLYYCKATNEFYSKSSKTKNISVWTLGNVMVSTTSQKYYVPIGSNIILQCYSTGNAENIKFQWFKSKNKTVSNTSTYAISNTQKNEDGIYYCKVTKGIKSKIKSIEFKVSWLDTPVIRFHNNQSTVTIFTNVRMSCHLMKSFPQPSKYIWYKDNIEIKSTFSSVIQLPIISSAYTGKYSCKAINELTSKISDKKQLTVASAPKIITSHKGTVSKGTNVNMTCYTSNQKEGTSLSWVTETGEVVSKSSTLFLVAVTEINSGRYRCKEKRDGAEIFSRFVEIKTIFLKKPTLEILPKSFIKPGGYVNLICKVYGSRPITYEIIKDGKVVQVHSDEGSSLVATYTNIQLTNAGTYSCTASNQVGKETSNEVTLNVMT